MTTFWIDAAGRLIKATSDPEAMPAGAVESTETAPDSSRHQTWNGSAWVDDADRAQQEQRRDDLQALDRANNDLAPLLIALIDWQLANTLMVLGDFSPGEQQAYQALKTITDRVKT